MIRIARRIAAAGAVGAFAVAAVWLLWADRGTVFGDRIVGWLLDAARQVERTTMVDLVDRSDIPATLDQVGHAILWAVGTVTIGVALLGRRPILATAAGVGVISLFAELAQPVVSTHRGFELSDAVANLVGVGLGTVALVALEGTLRLARRG